jgi:endoglucanase
VKALLLWLLAITSVAHAEVPPERLLTLSRGVNIIAIDDHIPTQKPLDEVQRDLAIIERVGFHHVRMQVNQDWFNGGTLTANWRIVRMDRIVEAATKHHLAVILALYSDRHPLNTEDIDPDSYWLAGWQQFAEHYRTVSPSEMFFEVANEPSMDGTRWSALQEQLRATIRRLAPMHTVLLTASPLSMSWSLDSLTISQDTDVVYVFHLYQPMVFTHQSADWADPAYRQIKGLEYPPNRSNIHAILSRPLVGSNPDAVKELNQYEHFGGTIMGDEITKAAQWSQEHGVHLMATEFGNDSTVAPQASRAAWLGAARQQFEHDGFGWTVWEYEGAFGIKADLQKDCKNVVVQSLGLCQ